MAALPTLCGDVVCENVRGRSTLTRCYSRSPLRLLTPRAIGRAASVVMSSFGGGLVSGDDVPVAVRVDGGAACVLATQSAGKVYRSDGRTCHQSLTATVAADGLLAVLPDPLACFTDARLNQHQTFDLTPTASLVWLDWVTSGRWAQGERWQAERIASRADVRIDGRLRLRETLTLDAASDVSPLSPFKAGRFDCYAVLVLIGPRLNDVIETAERTVADVEIGRVAPLLASSARIEDAGVVVRVLGPGAQAVQRFLRPIITSLAGPISADPWARKW